MMAVAHVGGRLRIIDEDQAIGFEIKLAIVPGLALLRNGRAVLLDCVASQFHKLRSAFLSHDPLTIKEPPQSADPHRRPAAGKPRLDLDKR